MRIFDKLSFILSNGISLILGLMREVLIAYIFGTSVSADILIGAITVPTLIYGAVENAIISATTAQYKTLGPVWFSAYIKKLAFKATLITFAVSLLSSVLFDGHTHSGVEFFVYALIVPIVWFRIMFLYYSTIMSLNSMFSPQAFLNPLQNLIVIIGLVCAHSIGNPLIVAAVAWVLGPAVAMLGLKFGVRLSMLNEQHVPPRYRLSQTTDVSRIVKSSSFASGLQQLAVYADRFASSITGIGGLPTFNYAFKLAGAITGVITVPLLQIILPVLKRLGSDQEFLSVEGLKIIISLIVPTGMFFFLNASIIAQMVFGHGSITLTSEHAIAVSSKILSLSLVPLAIYNYYLRLFTVFNKSRLIVRVTQIMVALNVTFDLVLIHFIGLKGVTVAIDIANWCGALVLMYWHMKNSNFIIRKRLLSFSSYLSVAMIAALLINIYYLNFASEILKLILSIAVFGSVSLFVLLFQTQFRPFISGPESVNSSSSSVR